MDETSEDRLQELESALAHLERQYEQLNEVVIEQGRRLIKWEKQIERMTETLHTIESERIRATNPKPPHYE